MSAALGGWRVALRLASREALRRKGQTVLMLVLICLPVLAVSAAAVAWQTADVNSVERLDRELGTADAFVLPQRGAVIQAFDPDDAVTVAGGGGGGGQKPGLGQVQELLGDRPAAAVTHAYLTYETDHGRSDLQVTALDLDDSLTDGLFRSVSGKAVPGPGEALVNATAAARGPGIGDDLVLSTGRGNEATLRVVGIAESASERAPAAVVGPDGLTGVAQGAETGWLVGGGPVDWDQVRALNKIGAVVTSRAVITDPPPDSELPERIRSLDDGPIDNTAVTVIVLVVIMVLIEVVLLAGPAFAVRAKRQSYALALIAAAGGTPAQSRRVVLATGVVVGVVGGVLGALLGIGVGWLALPLVQRANPVEYLGPFQVPWRMLAVVAVFGLVSALLAALVPALLASRQDVVAVLAGRRGEGRPSARSPFVGLGLIALAVAAAAVGAGHRGLAPILIGASAILSVLGMILLVPVVVVLVARLAGRLPLPLRFAARDAARHRTRTVPAVAAVAATVAGVVALGIAVASQQEADRETYQQQLPLGMAAATISPQTDPAAVRALIEQRLPDNEVSEVRGVAEETHDGWVDVEYRAGSSLPIAYQSNLGTGTLVGDRVPSAVPMTDAERQEAHQVLADGGVVVLGVVADAGFDVDLDADRVTVIARQHDDRGKQIGAKRLEVPALLVPVTDGATTPVAGMLPPDVARRLGLRVATTGILVDGPIDSSAEQDLREELAATPGTPYFYVEHGWQPDPKVRIIQLILGALGAVLMLGGTLTATFLALSDARPDLATMAAVGARPRTRRGVAASYALVVGLVGALLGAPIGFIPGLAVSRPLAWNWETNSGTTAVPWLLVAAVVCVLPLLTAVVLGACARSRLPMVARID